METVELIEQTGLCNNIFYPTDSSKFAVNKEATAYNFEKGESCFQNLIAKSMEGTFHVDQNRLAGYKSEFPKNGEMSWNKLHENVEPMDFYLRKQALCSHLHVTPSQSHSSTVLTEEKDKSDAHSPLVNADVLVQNNQTDKKFCSKGNPNPFASFSDLAVQSDSKKNLTVTHTQPPLSFVEAAKQCMKRDQTCKPLSQNEISSSLLKGNQVSDMDKDGGSRVIVPTETLMRRIELCKFSIIGRVILAKGEEAWPTKKLRERLNEVWSFKSSWRLISLGKGFFHLLLTSQEEYEMVWLKGAINLKPGVLRLQKWVFGFDPLKEKSTNAQVWFRFFNIPWCLWDVSVLTALSRKIGTPIRFDNNTINGDFGHYARVLIDVDLSNNIKEGLQLDCGKDIFDVKVVPESIPQFCKACSNIGHNSSECRIIRRNLENAKVMDELKNTKPESALQDRLKAQKGRKFGSWHAKGTHEVMPDDEHTKGNQKGKGIEEAVPDLGNQSQSVSNKFSALEEYEDTEMGNENKVTQNSGTEMTRKDNQKKGRNVLHDSAKGVHKDKGIEEMVPDIGNQPLSVPLLQGSKDIHTSNKFAALEEYEDRETGNENKGIQDSSIDEAICDDKVQKIPLSKGDVNHKLKGIRMWAEQEKRNITQRAEDSGQIGEKGVEEKLTPETPKRWSDIQDEEEEKEAHEAKPKPFFPKPTDILSFERNGELTEIFMSNGKIRFTPISDKK